MSSCRAIGRIGVVLLVSVGMAALAAEDPPDERPEQPPARDKDKIVKLAERFELAVGENPTLLEMEAEPVLYWPNPTREIPDGATFVWKHKGRPLAIGCVWRFGGLGWAFHSLAEQPVSAKLGGAVIWEPQKGGLNLRPLEGAPKPAATTTARLTQMRSLARRFECRLSGNGGESLRLLPQPVYRYDVNDDELVDGALFAFVQGTDPEVILTLEERGNEGSSAWNYALTRRSMLALEARLDDKEVWTALHGPGSPTEPWFQSGSADD